MIAATDRSISPEMISSAMASAISAFSVKLKVSVATAIQAIEEIGRGEAVDDEDRHRDADQQRSPRLRTAERSGLSSRSGMSRGAATSIGHALLPPVFEDDAALAAFAARVEHHGQDDGRCPRSPSARRARC